VRSCLSPWAGAELSTGHKTTHDAPCLDSSDPREPIAKVVPRVLCVLKSSIPRYLATSLASLASLAPLTPHATA